VNRIKLYAEADCAQATCCFPVDQGVARKQAWIEEHDLFVDSDGGRVLALVDTEDRVFFMDAVTGSLYQWGRCMTSDSLTLRGPVRDKELARSKLLSVKTEDDKSAAEVPAEG
jgi:hypothetical protein